MPLIGAQGPGSNISWRGNLDEYPDAFSFVQVEEIFPGTAATCSPVTITGINYKALVTAELKQPASAIAAGIAASVRVTPYIEETDSYGPAGDFLPGNDPNNLVIIRNKDKIELEILTEAPGAVGRSAFNATYSVDVNIGKRGPEGWIAKTRELDDDPDPFDFTDQNNLEINTLTNSDVVTVTGIDDTIGVDIFIVGTGELRINGGTWASTAKIFDGDTLQLRNTTSNFYSTAVTTTVQLGIFQADFVITTRPADTTINDFTFTDVINVNTNSVNESNSITISGADNNLNGNNPLSLTFSGNGEYQITRNGVVVVQYTDVSPSTCNNGDVIQLRQNASGSYSTRTDATLTVSNQSDTYSVTTRPRPIDTIPDAFTFTDQTNVLRNELIYSNTITLAGMTAFGDEGTASISGSSGANAKYQVTRGGTVVRSWTSGTFGVRLGDQIQLRLRSTTTSRGTASATFTVSGTNTFTVIGGVSGSTSDTWRVTSKARDCGVTSFSLPDITQGSSTLNPGDQAQTSFTVGGSFEFDCNITASTSNSNSFLRKRGTTQQGTTLNDVKQGDIIDVYMTTPYFCETRTTTVSLSAAFATSGSSRSANWTIAPRAPSRPSLTLTADNYNPPFVFPDGGSTRIRYEYTHVTNSSVTASGPGGFSGLTSISPTTLGDQTKSGSRVVSDLQSGQSSFSLTVSNCTGSTTESVNVITGTPPAPTLFFCVNRSAVSGCPTSINVARGTSARLYWSSTNAVRVEAVRGTGFSTGNRQSGNDSVTPSSDGEVYTARAIGAGTSPQTVERSITFGFRASVSLSVSPSNIITGQSVTITWSSTDADRVTASSGQSFSNITALSGSKTVTLNNDGTYTWSITVRNDSNGETDNASDSATAVNDTTVASFTMNPSRETNRELGERRESQPRFDSSPRNSVHGLSPNVDVTARVSGGGATFLNGRTTKTVRNGTACSDLRIKMNASNSFDTEKTATLNIGGVSRTFKVRTRRCTVENGTYGLAGCTLQTRRFKSNGPGNNIMGVIGVSGCSGTTGGNRENTSSGTIDRFTNQQNTTYTLPTGTSRVEAKGIAGGGGGGKEGSEDGSGGGGGGGAFKIEWNQAEGGDVIKFFAGRGGSGSSSRNRSGENGQNSWIEINGARTRSRALAEGGRAGGEKNGGSGGNGRGAGRGGSGGGRRGDEGGHGGGAGRTTGGNCSNGRADPGSRPCDQGGPGQGSTLSGGCRGSNRQEKGTEEGARGHYYGGGGSGGGCGNGGGRGGDGAVMITYTISYQRYNKTDVMRTINAAYWSKKNHPATGNDIRNWYNRFKDDPGTYPDLGTLSSRIQSSLGGGRAGNISDNCGGSYPRWT